MPGRPSQAASGRAGPHVTALASARHDGSPGPPDRRGVFERSPEEETMGFPKTAFLAAAVASLAVAATPARPEGAGPGAATVALHVERMMCSSCKAAVKAAVTRLPGVQGVAVDVASKTATVEYDPARVSPRRIAEAVNRAGYPAALPDGTRQEARP